MSIQAGFEDDFQYLMDYASKDWVGMSPVSATASAMAGKHPTLEQEISALRCDKGRGPAKDRT
ncbi:MAG TPA: hypothetical protein VGL64_09555 [Amycolatopsis sp.]|jgi:hypothetical protein